MCAHNNFSPCPPIGRRIASDMHRRFAMWLILPVCAAFLFSCGDPDRLAPADTPPELSKEETPVSATPEVAVETDTALEPQKPITTRDRTEVLGFARHIPADAEALVTLHEMPALLERMRILKLWNAASADLKEYTQGKQQADEEDFSDVQGLLHEEDPIDPTPTITPMELFNHEVTIALGKNATERLAAWSELNRRAAYHQARRIASQTSDMGELAVDLPLSVTQLIFGSFVTREIYGDLIQDRAAMRALDQLRFPPIYIAVRADMDRIDAIHEFMSTPLQALLMFQEMLAPVEVTMAGTTFRGYRLLGEDLASSIREGREYMDDLFGSDVIDRQIEFLKSRELVALSGILGDYSVTFYGSSIDEFQLAESPAQAITHGETLAFADPLLAHPFHGLFHGRKELMEALPSGNFADLVLGLRDGFATNDRDGRNRDLVALLQITSERARTLRALANHETTGITIFDDGGPRIDAYGSTTGILDFSTPSQLAPLGDSPDLAVFFNMSMDNRYSIRSTAYAEALFETTYTLLRRLMELSADHHDEEDDPLSNPLDLLKPHFSTFEDRFMGDFVNIWRAVAHDMRNGLGRECAIVVDLKGTIPAIPGIPKSLVGQANSPRVTFLAPVANRERLPIAWDKIHHAAMNITTRIGESQEREIPIPNPIRSESGGLTSWFLPLPFFDDEFLPSVTLDDRWFAIGTSRNQAVDLIKHLDILEARQGGGLLLKVNFGLIANSQREQIATLKANRNAILESNEIDAAEFDHGLAQLEDLADGLGELESLEARCWQQDGIARTSIHLRLRQP